MGDPLPTVEVEHPSNPDRKVILNEEDYDPDEYTLWGESGDEEEGEYDRKPLLDMTVAELREAVGDVEDAARLRTALAEEDRTTARDALQDRIAELEA